MLECGLAFVLPFFQLVVDRKTPHFERVHLLASTMVMFFVNFLTGMIFGLSISCLEVLVQTLLSSTWFHFEFGDQCTEVGLDSAWADSPKIWYADKTALLNVQRAREKVAVCRLSGT